MNNPVQANFLLIDGVLRPGAVLELHQRGEPLEIEPLYLATRWKELHDLGPVLVALKDASSLARETCSDATSPVSACLLYSSAPLRSVADHLRQFIAPPDVHGGSGLLRFADPLVARHWLDSHEQALLNTVLGPIEHWHVPEPAHRWMPAGDLAWRTFSRSVPDPRPMEGGARLGLAQLEALERASRWRFMERLHLAMEQNYPRHLARIEPQHLAGWFDERLDEARAWGLFSERNAAIWVEYSLRWGEGFTTQPDGAYPQWLARTPEAMTLAPEQRIQQMDLDCIGIETTRDV